MGIIEAHGLHRTFRSRGGTVDAVRGVELSVPAGGIVGFLGPNGAGKTTTVRMLATLLRPTAGTATVAGADLVRAPAEVRRRIGYVAQTGGTDPQCQVAEEVLLQARAYRMPAGEARRKTAQVLAELELDRLAERTVRTLSGGQRRRLDIALGMVHRPDLLFLDEPTVGLDPHSRGNVWDHVRQLRDDGTTVFLTTHYLDEADALCDKLFVIDHGRIVAAGSPDELKRTVSGDLVTVTINGDADAAKAALAHRPGVREVSVVGQTVRLVVAQGDRAIVDVIRVLDEIGVELRSIGLTRPSLDDVFLTITGRTLREGDG